VAASSSRRACTELFWPWLVAGGRADGLGAAGAANGREGSDVHGCARAKQGAGVAPWLASARAPARPPALAGEAVPTGGACPSSLTVTSSPALEPFIISCKASTSSDRAAAVLTPDAPKPRGARAGRASATHVVRCTSTGSPDLPVSTSCKLIRSPLASVEHGAADPAGAKTDTFSVSFTYGRGPLPTAMRAKRAAMPRGEIFRFWF